MKTRRGGSRQKRLTVEGVNEDSVRYRVHYVGYSHTFDEWKQKKEVVDLASGVTRHHDYLVGTLALLYIRYE